MKLDKLLKSKGLTCAIPYTKVGEMLRLIDETAKDDRERAMSFCGDGQELTFPSTIGEETGVMPPECPVGKQKLGDFHTHRLPEEEPGEKSMEDWFTDAGEDTYVSCLGLPEIDIQEGEAILKRTIACHTFHRQHPEFEDFQGRLFVASFDAMKYEDEIKEIMESRYLTPSECAKYKKYRSKVDTLVQEGIGKGIISPCVPKVSPAPETTLEKLSVPAVETMLEEQK